ncbi:Hsp20/alpha crystallin family protein [Baekduia sp. Peel2402]|uniref:Hsp20/alpha crystallin family protein n=1 Tax=Baekduia sp. Peel2402 TaxID=3458296 RepID=UPI00403ECC4F
MAVLVRRHNGGRNPQRMQPVQRYQPFRELEEIQQQTAQLLEQMMGVPPEVVRPWIPDVDIEETDDAWILEAELPGARAEDVHVEVDEGELTIRGAIAERERQGILRRRTRRVGEFEYTVTLPGLSGDVEPDARLHHGVLEVRVPKPEQAKPRQVQIREGDTGEASDSGTGSGSGSGSGS